MASMKLMFLWNCRSNIFNILTLAPLVECVPSSWPSSWRPWPPHHQSRPGSSAWRRSPQSPRVQRRLTRQTAANRSRIGGGNRGNLKAISIWIRYLLTNFKIMMEIIKPFVYHVILHTLPCSLFLKIVKARIRYPISENEILCFLWSKCNPNLTLFKAV